MRAIILLKYIRIREYLCYIRKEYFRVYIDHIVLLQFEK